MSTAATSLNAERALDILLLLGEAEGDGLSLATIATRIGAAKSTVHRSLVALIRKGFVEPAGPHGHYRLGVAVWMLARRNERLEPQIQRFRPGMSEFVRRHGFSTYLMVRSGLDTVCAELITRATPGRYNMAIGGRLPMGVAAGSVALLALMPAAAADQIITANGRRYLNHPAVRPVDAEVVAQQVRQARTRGYAVNMGYYMPGEGGLALPFAATAAYEVDVAVSFTAPVEMMTDRWMDAVIADLRDCLQQVPAGGG